MALFIQLPWLLIVGVLGNIVSFMVYLAPVPTFYKIVKRKSTEGFQSLPYLAALFSSMLWIYYAYEKSNANLLITINSIGCLIETIYIALYISYAPKKARMFTLQLLFLFNFGGFSLIAALSYFLIKGHTRVVVLGWICLVFSVIVFAAPLSIVRRVIRTKSVEFMPFSLSFFLTLNAVMWFFYGLLQNDLYILLPNIIGFVFGILQMALYIIYKKYPAEQELPTIDKQVINSTPAVHPEPELSQSLPRCDLQEQANHDQNTDVPNQV